MKNIFICLVTLFILPLLAETKVLVFAGSTRADSWNQMLAKEAAQIAKNQGAHVTLIELKNYPMPFYDGDLEEKEGMPKNAKAFRDLMVKSDAIIIASPEYNGSISAVLKNALDWASRNNKGPSREAFAGKKFAIMSASPSGMGGTRGLVHLQAIIQAVGGVVVETQVSVPNAFNAFDKKGQLKDPALKEQLKKEIEEL